MMAFLSQIRTLMSKNFQRLLLRHLTLCVITAFILPIALSVLFSLAKNLFVPPAIYGFGHARPIMTLPQAFEAARESGRNKVILTNNGYTGGDIDRVLEKIAKQVVTDRSMKLVRVDSENDLAAECRSTLRGVTTCFGAVIMRSSPSEGPGGLWNYTLRSDAVFWSEPLRFNVRKSTNVEQVYLLPLQHAVDTAIAGLNDSNSDPLAGNKELPFTSMTQEERERAVRKVYHKAIVNFMAVAFITTVIWITYHLTGFIAAERESGISQLLDAMMPVRQPWMAQAARIIAHHLSFTIIYAPAWIISSLVVRYIVFSNTSIAIVLIFHLLTGLALASMSILFASFFKKAQLSGITAILSTLLLAILAQTLTKPSIGPVAILSTFFTPCTYVYFLTLMARFEKQNSATSLTETPPNSPWELPGIVFFVLLIIHIFVYPLLGALIETKLHGTSTKGRKIQWQQDDDSTLGENAVQLDKLTKIYSYPSIFRRLLSWSSKPREPVMAVNELSFTAGKGQIVALLGANGSGKSTTLNAIAGLHKITSGSITIDGRGGVGIVPQKNVLWDDLSVEEHLIIFNRLKSPGAPASNEEITELITSIDLDSKRKSLAGTLSGGQKRKLQLGMMLTGGSTLCCIDEVSSGLDPLSRRKIWDILLAERGRRTLILTTHFLDEADLLADHIAILSKGKLRAEGSSVELKDRFGGGYRVHIHKNPDILRTPSIDGVIKQDAFDLVTYVAPTSNLAARVVRSLEKEGITDYRFSGPTIEDVFLQLAEEIRDEEAFKGTDIASARGIESNSEKDEVSVRSTQPSLKLLDGKRLGYAQQVCILFRKRFVILKRNWILYLIAFLLPILAAGLTSLYVTGKKRKGCSPQDQTSSSSIVDAFTRTAHNDSIVFLVGPATRISVASVSRLFQPLLRNSGIGPSLGSAALKNLKSVDTFDAFQDYIRDHRKNVITAVWLGDSNQPPTLAWVANLFITSSITAQQFLNMLLTNTTISTTWSSFDVPFNPIINDTLKLVIYTCIALACYPAIFALYPSTERRQFVRALQYSNGVRPFPLWAAYLLFDFSIALVSSVIVTIMWASLSGVWFHLEYVFVVLSLYGLASILLAYVISLFTETQLAAFAWAAAGQAVFFLGYLIAYVCVLAFVQVSHIDSTLLACHFIISAFAPIASAARALFLTTNLFSTACDGNQLSTKPGNLTGYGGPILYLIIQCIVLFGFLLWFESSSNGLAIHNLFKRNKSVKMDGDSNEDMANELTRVTNSDQAKDGLRVMHLTKSFGKNTVVDNVTFGIKRGEVFALLGPNGAGKSTTISLIRGDIKPSLIKSLATARTHLGVCPQIDALDEMTVREHLEFYARVRGVPDVEYNVSAVLRTVGLEAFASRMGHALSGGNKRKLSLGIALIGNPTVLLLDEPSSGLDAASKRVIWRTLMSTVPGRSILLTTHSMEEADALAGRVGILAHRILALGTPDNLRHRFGDALYVHLVCSTAPRTTDAEMQHIISWVREKLPSAVINEKMYHGQLRFAVSATTNHQVGEKASVTIAATYNDITAATHQSSAIGQLVVLLEENKKMLGVDHYSVSPTTLDQVFLTIVGGHNVQEENHKERQNKLARFWNFGSL
ncbi:ATP-binding cassette sub-family A member 4 [Cladobotryum mycophilum]|uniref:ATP-binding cassette sub-family A member 4 n=1 Tax=Cladobotryum mycophilum TaxID=491253 RepID=A0ABR0S9P3_9HYPO